MVFSDKDLVGFLGDASEKYVASCNKLFKVCEVPDLQTKTKAAKRFGVQNLRLVNSTHILTLVVDCPVDVNCIKILADHLPVACISPKMMSKVFFRISGFTISVSLKSAVGVLVNGQRRCLQVIGANMAGCCSMESVMALGHDLGKLVEASSPGNIKVLNCGYQLVNNVIIMNIGDNDFVDIEQLINSKMDRLIKYDPTKFPGATFEAGDDHKDCQVLIAFTTGLFSFLGSTAASVLEETLPRRLDIIRTCRTGEKNDTNPKKRQIKRVMNSSHSQQQKKRIKPEEEAREIVGTPFSDDDQVFASEEEEEGPKKLLIEENL